MCRFVESGLKPDLVVPAHVAIIMDGNGRWARRGGLLRIKGHELRVRTVRDIVEAAAEWGVAHLTLYAFSSENWSRPKSEIRALMKLLEKFLIGERDTLLNNDVRLKAIGDLNLLPEAVLKALRETEELSARCNGMVLRLALSYGGRQELLSSISAIANKLASGELEPEQIDERTISNHLYDPDMPDPDLIIRTAGEHRLSNFLLWQSSYAEFHFTDILWPDFRREHLELALRDYSGRVRRFGGVVENDSATKPSC